MFSLSHSLFFSCCPCDLSVYRNLPKQLAFPAMPVRSVQGKKGFSYGPQQQLWVLRIYVSTVVFRVLFNTPAISIALSLSLSLSQYTLFCVAPSVVLFVRLSILAIGLRAMLR